LKTAAMLKNVKIDPSVHRRLSMKAATLGAQKGELCDALLTAALDHLTDEQILTLLSGVTNNDLRGST
jgi:Kef-type K+ transport system membrane component KefB